VQSWDTAFKSGAENDYSLCTTWGVSDNAYYLLWLWRDRVEFPELKKRMRWLAEEWKPTQILVEDRASGQSLIPELRYSTCLPITPVKVDTDKMSRAQSVTPRSRSDGCSCRSPPVG
jgi:phage terminase large subunit-like protein